MKMTPPPKKKKMGHFSFSTCPEHGNGCSQQSLKEDENSAPGLN